MGAGLKPGQLRDGSGHSVQRCIACGRPYQIYRCYVINGRQFCSNRCHGQSRRAFYRALASGQLEGILKLPVCQEVLNGDAPAIGRRAGKWQA
jgi:hypothetical protein